MRKKKADGIFPMRGHRSYDFRQGIRLGIKDHLTSWKKPRKPYWMTQKAYDTYPDSLLIREFKVSGRVYVSTFLDSQDYPKKELVALYEQRWQIEVNLRSLKTILKMEMLSCKTPSMVRKEIGIHFLAYNAIRFLMAQAGHRYQVSPQQLSFKATLQLLNQWMPYWSSSHSRKYQDFLYEELLKRIVQHRVGRRPGRVEPRVVKRRPKAFPRLSQPRSILQQRLRKKQLLVLAQEDRNA